MMLCLWCSLQRNMPSASGMPGNSSELIESTGCFKTTVHVIIRPVDSQMANIAAASGNKETSVHLNKIQLIKTRLGYPVASLSLGFIDCNRRGFGMLVMLV